MVSSITRPCRPANGDGSGAPWCSLCLRAEGDKEDERYVGGDAQGGDGADGGCLDVGREDISMRGPGAGDVASGGFATTPTAGEGWGAAMVVLAGR